MNYRVMDGNEACALISYLFTEIAGELLPSVINVASRTVSTHALSIFGDHSDKI